MESAVSDTVNAALRISNRIEAGKCDWKWSKAPGWKPVRRRLLFKAQAAAMALRQAVSHNVIINKECYIKSNQEVRKNSDVVVVTKAVAVDQCSDNVVHGDVSGSSYMFITDLLVLESVGSNVGKVVRKEKEKEKEKKNKKNKDNSTVKFASWNIRSFSKAGTQVEGVDLSPIVSKRPDDTLKYAVKEMIESGIDFMGVQETKIRGEGSLSCDNDGDGATLYYSGMADVGKLRNGVGIIVKNSLLKDIKQDGVHCVSDRIMWLEGCFYGKEMAVVSVYAPTETSSHEDKLAFYHQLDEMIASIPRIYEMKVVLGDWNARIGVYREEWDHVRGRHIEGECNDNGNLLLQLCKRSEFFISATNFEKKSYTTHVHVPTQQEWTLDHCLFHCRVKSFLLIVELILRLNVIQIIIWFI
jgi:exonuclease III